MVYRFSIPGKLPGLNEYTAANRTHPNKGKVKRAGQRIFEFVDEMDKRGYNAHVSVGGLDSITLLVFLRSLCSCGISEQIP